MGDYVHCVAIFDFSFNFIYHTIHLDQFKELGVRGILLWGFSFLQGQFQLGEQVPSILSLLISHLHKILVRSFVATR